jgi:hypothetical protein
MRFYRKNHVVSMKSGIVGWKNIVKVGIQAYPHWLPTTHGEAMAHRGCLVPGEEIERPGLETAWKPVFPGSDIFSWSEKNKGVSRCLTGRSIPGRLLDHLAMPATGANRHCGDRWQGNIPNRILLRQKEHHGLSR